MGGGKGWVGGWGGKGVGGVAKGWVGGWAQAPGQRGGWVWGVVANRY